MEDNTRHLDSCWITFLALLVVCKMCLNSLRCLLRLFVSRNIIGDEIPLSHSSCPCHHRYYHYKWPLDHHWSPPTIRLLIGQYHNRQPLIGRRTLPLSQHVISDIPICHPHSQMTSPSRLMHNRHQTNIPYYSHFLTSHSLRANTIR